MTIKSAHSRVFEQLVAAWREQVIEALTTGVPQDYAAYRQCVGQLEGLAAALKLSDEADFKLNGDDVGSY